MERSSAVGGFSLAYERHGSGAPVVLLHGWPGDHGDWREVGTRLEGRADVVVPDLRGFGESDKHVRDPAQAYSATGQAASVASLLGELELGPAVIAGYDVGSRVAQQIARSNPELVRALVLAPPLPGAGDRVLSADPQREFWYQHFHRLDMIEKIIDGRPHAVRAYLEHFWSHWSGPARSLAERAPAPDQRIAAPTALLWPEHDPLFPLQWADRLDEFFSAVTLRRLPDAGHFSPLEASERFAEAIRDAL